MAALFENRLDNYILTDVYSWRIEGIHVGFKAKCILLVQRSRWIEIVLNLLTSSIWRFLSDTALWVLPYRRLRLLRHWILRRWELPGLPERTDHAHWERTTGTGSADLLPVRGMIRYNTIQFISTFIHVNNWTGTGMWWWERANTYWGKCWGRIYQGKGREYDRKQDGKTHVNEIWKVLDWGDGQGDVEKKDHQSYRRPYMMGKARGKQQQHSC